MNVPKLRFKEFSNDWEEKKLGEIGKIIGGGTPDSNNENYWNGSINWFTPTEIKDKYICKSERKITELGLNNSSAKLLPKGTLLFTSRATIGDCSISLEECTTNQGFQSIIVNKENNNECIYYLLSTLKNKFLKNSSGSTFLEISKYNLEKILVNIPNSLQEQEKIANFLSSVDRKIELTEDKLEAFKEYKKGVMQKIFSQEIRFKDENGNDYPEWEEKKLGSVCFCLDNLRKPLNESERNKIFGDIPYYGANGIQGYINKYIFDEELILLAEDGGHYEEFYTRPIAQYITGKSWVNNHAHILKGKEELKNKFLFYSLVHKDIREYINGTSRGKLNKSDMLNIVIKIPSLPEQEKIANFLSTIDEKIEKIENSLNELKEFKKGLLQQMFV